MKTRPMRALGAGLGLALSAALLVGCGSDDESDNNATDPTSAASSASSPTEEPTDATEEPTEETESPTESPSEEAGQDESGSAAGDKELTPLGTELAVGDPAVVKAESSGKEFVMELTVNKITQAEPSQLDAFKSDSFKPGEWDAAYIEVTGTVVSGNAENGNPADDVEGMAGEVPGRPLIKFTAFEPCENESFETGKPGESVTSCAIILAKKGTQIDRATYAESYSDEPITWK